jgi:hypothetical protein
MSANADQPGSGASSVSDQTIIDDKMQDVHRETTREDLNTTNPNGSSNIGQGINVKEAEREFHELSKQLSRLSQVASHKSVARAQSRSVPADPEKQDFEEEEDGQFDLEDHLRSTEDSEREAGIRAKHIGMFCLGRHRDSMCWH